MRYYVADQCHLCALLLDCLSHVGNEQGEEPPTDDALTIKFDSTMNGFLLWIVRMGANIDAADPALQATNVPGQVKNSTC
jgi:hypothetical protein